jgi:TRAP-type mannitol/chloroaromatic compound transport system permease small subunit
MVLCAATLFCIYFYAWPTGKIEIHINDQGEGMVEWIFITVTLLGGAFIALKDINEYRKRLWERMGW